jgi:hypothetical protein
MWSVETHVSDGVECRPGWTQGFSWAELWRGMGHAQRDGACDGNETEMGGLHPKGEPDTFYSSHRCLLTRRLWSGARSVLKHQRVLLSQVFLAFFCDLFFLCFLPFAIFGRTLRTLSISFMLHSRTRTPPSFRTFGAGTFLAKTYR